jgi:Rab GDP dissociation inhibitor
MYQKFKGEDAKVIEALARDRPAEYCVDASPKFLMACGKLVACLQKLIPEDYLTFGSVMGSFVFNKNSLHKVPSSAQEGLSSGLLGMMQKVRFRSFINFVAQYDHEDAKTHDAKFDLTVRTMAEMYKYYSIDQMAQTFVSHALALQADEKHLQEPALPIVQKVKLYADSFLRFGQSPYIYPHYGLGGLAESFSRLSSIYGCTFITGAEVKQLDFNEDGSFAGLQFNHYATGDIKATAKQIIGDPSYFAPEKSTKIAQIARSIVVLSAPIPKAAENCQIIIPGINVSPARANDIYVSALSSKQRVCPNGRYLAVISTTFDGAHIDISDSKAAQAACQRELKTATSLFAPGSVVERFDWVTEQRGPAGDTSAQGVFMTQSFDATTHFQSVMDEIFAVYKSVSGKDFDLNALRSTKEMQEEAMQKQAEEMAKLEAAEKAAAAETAAAE